MVKGKKKQKCLSRAEIQNLLLYVKSQADSARKRGTTRAIIDELIVNLLARAGLRPNEISMLIIEDITEGHEEKALRIRNKTGEVIRTVEISEDVAHLLTRFVRLYRKGAKKKDLILQTERGNPFGYMSLYSKVLRIGKQAGIGKLSPSILRNTYMVRLYEAEQDLRYVQEQAGYVSCSYLAKYLTNSSEKRKRVKGGSIKLTKKGSFKQKGKLSKHACKCEACGSITDRGRRIDSGQFLCHECLKYFSTGY